MLFIKPFNWFSYLQRGFSRILILNVFYFAIFNSLLHPTLPPSHDFIKIFLNKFNLTYLLSVAFFLKRLNIMGNLIPKYFRAGMSNAKPAGTMVLFEVFLGSLSYATNFFVKIKIHFKEYIFLS